MPFPSSFTSSKFGVPVTFIGVVSLVIALFLSGCKEGDSDKIADAQACLDDYARNGGGDLTECEEYVEGLTTPVAHGIRCASGFIREGFSSAQSFIDAFEQIETVDGNSVRAFLRIISFDSAGTGSQVAVTNNYNAAQKVYVSCAASQAKGATMIATFSYLTNLLFKYDSDNGPGSGFLGSHAMDDSSLAAAILVGATDNTAATTSMKTELGTMVVNTQQVSCSNGEANEDLCKFMNTAIDNAGGPANKALVGEEFIKVLANPPA